MRVCVSIVFGAVFIVPLLAGCGQESDSHRLDVPPSNSLSAGVPVQVRTLAQPPTPTPEPLPAKRVAVSPDEIVRGPADQPRVSLVINAGAGYPPAEDLLAILASRGVRTTFFLMGWWAERNPDLVRRIHAEGHEIASHGYREFDLTRVSDAAVVADLERAEAVISSITGQTTKPLWSPSAGYRDARVRRIAAGLGYRPILWTQDSGDWRETASPQGVLERALAGAVNGAIIVLHLDSPRSRTATAAILGQLIDMLRQRGLEPVTITELVGE
jgi:peptidoglycan/xylan/chitin deacetylase (PgdA/CDA1 family)